MDFVQKVREILTDEQREKLQSQFPQRRQN
jgi:hypothetical protein